MTGEGAALPASSNIERAIGVVIGKLDGIEDRLDRQDASRAVLHRRMDELVEKTVNLESELSSMRKKVEAHEEVTVQVKTLRNEAIGAGRLGGILLRIGA